MKIGLYFGSFNPIHIGHLIIANHFQQFSDLDQVWFVVSPQNPFKEKKSLANEYERLNMVELAIEGYPNLRASNIEFSLTQPSYTIHTLLALHEKYPKDEFSLIMGADNLRGLKKWKNYEQIIKNHPIYVYPRYESEIKHKPENADIHVVNAPLIEISSTFIRDAIRDKKNIKPMLPGKVWEYIDGSILYS